MVPKHTSKTEIIFDVTKDDSDGRYSASALGYRIHPQGGDWADLKAMVRDAVLCYFDEEDTPRAIRLRFVRDEPIDV